MTWYGDTINLKWREIVAKVKDLCYVIGYYSFRIKQIASQAGIGMTVIISTCYTLIYGYYKRHKTGGIYSIRVDRFL